MPTGVWTLLSKLMHGISDKRTYLKDLLLVVSPTHETSLLLSETSVEGDC
jgi:hypothetical protein